MNMQVKNSSRPLWHFHGGLHIDDHKAVSLQQPLKALSLPDILVVPLQQHIGEIPDLLVKAGDQVKKGQLIADPGSYISAALHAPTSGTVVDIAERVITHPSGLTSPCVIIQPDGKDEWFAGLPEPLDYQTCSPAELGQRIRWAGIVGLGGATFPSSVKLNPGPDKTIKTLIINGAECEPYITCDDMLMQTRAADIISGIKIVMHMLSAEECLIGVEDNKPLAIQALQQALEADADARIEVVRIPTIYPSGGEKQLIRILTGKEVPSHGLPANIGIVCHNVATIVAIDDAIKRGKPLISRIVTVTGAGIRQPGNYEVINGTPIGHLINQAGGLNADADRMILGGPMMGHTLKNEQIPLTKGANCILLTTKQEIPPTSAPVACIRCGKCAEVCPVQLLPQQLYWFAKARDLDKAQDYNLFDCIECGCCSHVCPSHIPLVQYYRYAKTEIWTKEEEKRKSDHARQRHEFRQARLERLEAEKKARLRKSKEALEKKKSAGSDDKAVDPKKAAIEAAMKRAAEKKKKLQEAGQAPANTSNLTEDQLKQIEAAEKRRKGE